MGNKNAVFEDSGKIRDSSKLVGNFSSGIWKLVPE